MEIFRKAFDWLADLSAKLPAIDLKTYFIVVVAIIAGVGVIIGLTFFGSRAFKLKKACKKIVKYLSNVDAIDDDNLADFVNQCFSIKAPQSLRDAWVEYLNVRFGFPSEIVSQQKVLDQEIKKVKDIRANVFVGIALILLAIFAFWGFGTLDSISMSVIHCAGLLLAGVGYLVLVVLNRSQIKKTTTAFALMQEELDVKVYLQVEKNYATDSSPLNELAAMVDEIVARNTSKIVDITDELNQEDLSTLQEDDHATPIESLIAFEEEQEQAQEEQIVSGDEQEEQVVEEQTVQADEVEQTEEAEEIIEEPSDELQEQVAEPIVEEDNVGEPIVEAELAIEEDSQGVDEAQEDVESPQEIEEDVTVEVQEQAIEEGTPEVQEQEIEEETTEVQEQETVEDSVVEEAVENVAQETVEDAAQETVQEAYAEEPIQEDFEEVEEETEVIQETEQHQDEVAPEDEINDVEESLGDASLQEDEIGADTAVEEETLEEQAVEEEEESIVYVVDGPEEDEIEDVKPAKLVKLPHLVDYVISKDFPQPAKMKIAQILIDVYNRYQDSPEDRKIAKNCLAKFMLYLKN